MTHCLLDTNTVSYYLKNRHGVRDNLHAFLDEEGTLCLSVLSQYEVLRGLYHDRAARRLKAFEQFLQDCIVLPFNAAALEASARLWTYLAKDGESIGELDTLIAGTGLATGLPVITANQKHFGRVPGLRIENWATF